MRLFIAALAMALMMAGAQAQIGPQNSQMNAAQQIGQHASQNLHDDKSDGQKVKANDKAYNAALHNLPDKQYDPWHGMR